MTGVGFQKIKPVLSGVGCVAGGDFTAVFTNGVGTEIKVTGVSATLSDGVLPMVYDVDVLSVGENITLSCSGCCPTQKETYAAGLEISYDVQIGTTVYPATESGTIRGCMD